mgnify:CR=1 FL=1
METVPSKEIEYYLLINRLLNCPTREEPLCWKERQNAYYTLKEAFKYRKEICKEVEKILLLDIYSKNKIYNFLDTLEKSGQMFYLCFNINYL